MHKNVLAILVMMCIATAGMGPILACGEADGEAFPKYEPRQITLRVPADKVPGLDDPASRVGDQFVYEGVGQIFEPLSSGEVPLLESVDKLRDDCIFSVLAKLRYAYANRDTDAVKALYDEASQAFIDQMLAQPEIRERFIAIMASIEQTRVAIILEYELPEIGEVLLVFDLSTLQGQEGRHVMTTALRNTGTAQQRIYRSVAAHVSEPMFGILDRFLVRHDPDQLVSTK